DELSQRRDILRLQTPLCPDGTRRPGRIGPSRPMWNGASPRHRPDRLDRDAGRPVVAALAAPPVDSPSGIVITGSSAGPPSPTGGDMAALGLEGLIVRSPYQSNNLTEGRR